MLVVALGVNMHITSHVNISVHAYISSLLVLRLRARAQLLCILELVDPLRHEFGRTVN